MVTWWPSWRVLSLWRWSGTHWVVEAQDLMPDLHGDERPLACYSPADGGYLVGCVTTSGTLRLVRLGGNEVERPPVALGRVLTGAALAVEPSTGELVLHLTEDTFTISQGQARLRAHTAEIRTVAADPVAGRLVGIDKFDATFAGVFSGAAAAGWRHLTRPRWRSIPPLSTIPAATGWCA